MKFVIEKEAMDNLIRSYAESKLECEWWEMHCDEDEDELYDNADYSHHTAVCYSYERWMIAAGIDPQSNYVANIINKVKMEHENDC